MNDRQREILRFGRLDGLDRLVEEQVLRLVKMAVEPKVVGLRQHAQQMVPLVSFDTFRGWMEWTAEGAERKYAENSLEVAAPHALNFLAEAQHGP